MEGFYLSIRVEIFDEEDILDESRHDSINEIIRRILLVYCTNSENPRTSLEVD